MKLFKTFKSWKTYLLSSLSSVFVGVLRILWSIVGCIISFIANVIRSAIAFCRREFGAAIVIVFIIVAIVFAWLYTFANERAARVYAEHERDSLSLKLDVVQQDSFVIHNHWESNQ